MTSLALVDSPEAVAAARRDRPRARLATDNPLLAHAFEKEVENIDRLVPQARALELGRAALDLTDRIEQRLAQDDITRHFGLPAGVIGVTGPISRLVASLFHRGAVLAHALSAFAPGEIVLCIVETPRWEPTQPLILPRFASPARSLAGLGFFGSRPLDIVTVEAALPERVNDTAIDDWGRRIAMVPFANLAYELASRLRLPLGWNGRIVVGQENEAIRETLPWLALAGIRTQRAGGLAVGSPRHVAGFDAPAEISPVLSAALETDMAGAIAATGEFEQCQTDALTQLILQHLSAGLAHLAGRLPDLQRRIDTLFPQNGATLLTNGLFGPAGMMVHRLCEKKHVRVIEFEHGVTAGLAALTERKLKGGALPPVDALLVCSARAAESFNGALSGAAQPIGLPDQVRQTLRRPLQRRLARRALGLGRRTVVMHVSTLPYFGNHRPGHGAPTETTTFTLDRTLIEQVYPALAHDVVFKQYPTQRFPFEPGYETLFRLAPNIRITKDEDFRYIRAAADIIVTMTPTSTLGWCVGAGKPLVWLDSRIVNPLSQAELRDAFRDAFLFVDLEQPDWPEQLRGLLDRDLGEILADWNARRPAREALLREAVVGPAGPTGKRAAALVLDVMRGPDRAPVAQARQRASA